MAMAYPEGARRAAGPFGLDAVGICGGFRTCWREGATRHSKQEVVRMGRITDGSAWAMRKVRRLRSLTKGEDADPWYEERRAKRDKPPNVGPNLGGG